MLAIRNSPAGAPGGWLAGAPDHHLQALKSRPARANGAEWELDSRLMAFLVSEQPDAEFLQIEELLTRLFARLFWISPTSPDSARLRYPSGKPCAMFYLQEHRAKTELRFCVVGLTPFEQSRFAMLPSIGTSALPYEIFA